MLFLSPPLNFLSFKANLKYERRRNFFSPFYFPSFILFSLFPFFPFFFYFFFLLFLLCSPSSFLCFSFPLIPYKLWILFPELISFKVKLYSFGFAYRIGMKKTVKKKHSRLIFLLFLMIIVSIQQVVTVFKFVPHFTK